MEWATSGSRCPAQFRWATPTSCLRELPVLTGGRLYRGTVLYMEYLAISWAACQRQRIRLQAHYCLLSCDVSSSAWPTHYATWWQVSFPTGIPSAGSGPLGTASLNFGTEFQRAPCCCMNSRYTVQYDTVRWPVCQQAPHPRRRIRFRINDPRMSLSGASRVADQGLQRLVLYIYNRRPYPLTAYSLPGRIRQTNSPKCHVHLLDQDKDSRGQATISFLTKPELVRVSMTPHVFRTQVQIIGRSQRWD
jgi:hypothetical protein